MNGLGQIYRVKTTSISFGQQNWPKGSLISGDRLGSLAAYFERLSMIEKVVLQKVDLLEEPRELRLAA